MRKIKKNKLLIAALVMGMLVTNILSVSAAEVESDNNVVEETQDPIVVEINEENFPDEMFRNYIATGSHEVAGPDGESMVEVVYDANKDGKLSESEIANIQQLLMGNMPISDVTGVNYFTSVIELQCQMTKIHSLDVSHLEELKWLNCYSAQLEGTLDLSNNIKLEGVACQENRNLTEINVTGCTELDNIFLDATNVREIDFSTNTKLRSVGCADTLLKSLDFSNCNHIEGVSAYNSALETINLENCSKLTTLDVSGTNLESLDISDCENLDSLIISMTNIKEIDLKNNPKLTTIVASTSTELLNVNENTEIKWVNQTTWEVPEDSFDITEYMPGVDVSKIQIDGRAELDGNIVSGYFFDERISVRYEDEQGRMVTLMIELVKLEEAPETPSPDDETPNVDDENKDPENEETPSTEDDKSNGDDKNTNQKTEEKPSSNNDTKTDTKKEASTENKATAPKTGDGMQPLMWMTAILLSSIAITILSYGKLKNDR